MSVRKFFSHLESKPEQMTLDLNTPNIYIKKICELQNQKHIRQKKGSVGHTKHKDTSNSEFSQSSQSRIKAGSNQPLYLYLTIYAEIYMVSC